MSSDNAASCGDDERAACHDERVKAGLERAVQHVKIRRNDKAGILEITVSAYDVDRNVSVEEGLIIFGDSRRVRKIFVSAPLVDCPFFLCGVDDVARRAFHVSANIAQSGLQNHKCSLYFFASS